MSIQGELLYLKVQVVRPPFSAHTSLEDTLNFTLSPKRPFCFVCLFVCLFVFFIFHLQNYTFVTQRPCALGVFQEKKEICQKIGQFTVFHQRSIELYKEI